MTNFEFDVLRSTYITPAIVDLASNIAEDNNLTCKQATDLIKHLRHWLGDEAFKLAVEATGVTITAAITPPEPKGFVVPTYDYNTKEEPKKDKRGHKPGTKLGPQLRVEDRNRILDDCIVLTDAAHESGLDRVVIKPEDVGVSPTALRRASAYFVPYFVNSHKPYALDKKPVYGVMGLTVFLRKERKDGNDQVI